MAWATANGNGPKWLVISFVIVAALCAASYLFADQAILLWVHHWPEAVKVRFREVTDLGKAEFFLVPAAAVFLLGKGGAYLARRNPALSARLDRLAVGVVDHRHAGELGIDQAAMIDLF